MKIIKSGQVRKIYDASNGKRIKHISSIENGSNLILSAFDPFRKGNYKLIQFRNNTVSSRTVASSTVTSSTVAGKDNAKDVSKIIKIFPNGDAYHSGVGITVTKRNYTTLQKVSFIFLI
jgi:hypothetical protein